MPKSKGKITVGITMGDPSGIGPAITLKAINKLKNLADFVVIGDLWVLQKLSALNSQLSTVKFIDLRNVSHRNFTFGKVKPDYGKASMEYLDCAIKLIKDKKIDCLVTCPISKESINMAGYHFSGHTEYLAKKTGCKKFAMMLINKSLKFVLLTRHIPLSEVSLNLNKIEIQRTVSLAHESLKKMFLLKYPRVVICGLNPHASDNGLLGNEENKIIKPAIRILSRKFPRVYGPLPADVAISLAYKNKYDCVIAMYHDQALIPLKLTDSFTGVNLTLGLGFIRTSPLHGTAFDIASNFSLANPASLIEAVKIAVKCSVNATRV